MTNHAYLAGVADKHINQPMRVETTAMIAQVGQNVFGYLAKTVPGKHERNIRILRKWVAGEPDCIFSNFKLGNTLVDVGQNWEALGYLDRTYGLFAQSSKRFSAPFLPAFAIVYHKALLDAGLNKQAEAFERTVCDWIKVLFKRFPQLVPADYSGHSRP